MGEAEIVPQIGGRLIQVTFGGHDFLYVNPSVQGQVVSLETKGFEDRNYGGEKIWPMPRAIRMRNIGLAAESWMELLLQCRSCPPDLHVRCG